MHKSKLSFLLNQARHAWMKRLNAECTATLDVTVSQLTALFALSRPERLRMSDLSRVLMLDNAAITRIAQRLEARGLARREPCENDRRAKQLVITDRGQTIAHQGRAQVAKANNLMRRGFTDDEMAVVERWLQHLKSQTLDSEST